MGLRSHSAPSALNPPLVKPVTQPQPPAETPAAPSGPPAPAIGLPPDAPVVLQALHPPDIHAAGAILVDAVSGQVLYAKNADLERPMASTTKIMTALLYCEHVPETDVIVASPTACKVRDSSLHLKPGEHISAHDMLCAILMRSANDGCVAAAEHVAGSEAAFVEMMNRRAVELGALHTHFANPHGLTAPGHYTTARDLALIARAAMKEPRIRDIVKTQICRIERSIDHNDVTMRNHSHFLGKFPGADGVKTGWTIPAGHCYVGSATWGKWRLISVVLKSPNYVAETSAMMKYGFTSFAPKALAQAGEVVGQCIVGQGDKTGIPAIARDTLQVVVRKGENPSIERQIQMASVDAPVHVGMVIGTMNVSVDGKQVASTPLVAGESVASTAILKQAIGSAAEGGMGRKMALALGILGAGLVSLRYGTRYGIRFAAVAKSARRRRRRLAARLRNDDLLG